MKNPFLSLLLLALPCVSSAETILLKDGKSHTARDLRRDGNFLFYKPVTADGAQPETVTPLNQIERIDFGEQPALDTARELFKQGDALGVLEKTTEPAAYFRTYSDVAGNQWADVMRLRIPAIAVAGTEQHLANLEAQWSPTGDQDIDTAYRLLLAAKNDPTGARTAWKALAQPGASSLAAGISWLGIGNEALLAKQWSLAVRAYLSVEVFVTQQRLLQPKALLGAAKAFIQKGEMPKAMSLIEEIKMEYPSYAEDAAAVLK
jgi:hypothetical protein